MKFLTKVFAFLGIIFRKLKKINEKYVFPALDILTFVRAALKSDEIDWLVNLTNSDWDNKIIEKITKKLSQSILFLEIELECSTKTNPIDVINCFIDHLKGQPVLVQDAILSKVAAVMFKKSLPPNYTVPQNEADLVIQMAYSTNKCYKKRNEAITLIAEEKQTKAKEAIEAKEAADKKVRKAIEVTANKAQEKAEKIIKDAEEATKEAERVTKEAEKATKAAAKVKEAADKKIKEAKEATKIAKKSAKKK